MGTQHYRLSLGPDQQEGSEVGIVGQSQQGRDSFLPTVCLLCLPYWKLSLTPVSGLAGFPFECLQLNRKAASLGQGGWNDSVPLLDTGSA